MAQEIADSTLLDTWASGGNIVEPDSAKIIEGWQLGEQPPHEYMNWLQNTFGSKLNHILKNGVASWNNETEYLAGSSVQHNGNVWLCKTTNTNSEPADVNANWKRIITVESLENLSVGYVATTGDQTIDGIKTFSSNPLSTTSQSTNSNALTKYSAVVKNTGDETIDGIKTFSSSPIAPTPTTGDNSTKVATTAYVDGKMVLGTAVNSTSVTSIDFTGIPSWVKKIKILFNGVSTSATSHLIVQLGDSGGIVNTAYTSLSGIVNVATPNSTGGTTSAIGFVVYTAGPTDLRFGQIDITKFNGNTWIESHNIVLGGSNWATTGGGNKTLSNTLDRIRITTANGTDTFDAGSINIMYEG